MKTFLKKNLYHFVTLGAIITLMLFSGYFYLLGEKEQLSLKHENNLSRLDVGIKTLKQLDNDTKEQGTNNKEQISLKNENNLSRPDVGIEKQEQLVPTLRRDNTINRDSEINNQKSTITINDQTLNVEMPRDSTVYDAMLNLQKNNQINFSGKEYSGLGFFVDEINGIKNDSKTGTYWIYYLNGETGKVGISNYKLKQNDKIEWKYEKANF